MSSLDQLRHQLEKEAGVSPSITWLGRCLRHIREANGGGPNDGIISGASSIGKVEADGIWDQIRHSDLRNVIREPSSISNDNVDNATNTSTAAMQLRHAIAQSKIMDSTANNKSGSKACLPQNFQLMIQLEEVIDATMNSEQQLASMGGNNNLAASSNNNSSNGNNHNYGQGTNRSEKWRCLKLVFSDGYCPNGRGGASLPANNNNDNDQENDVIYYAMETSPITNLSTASVPGTKLLLHGSIQIRFGLLQLCDENTFVIGGQVPSWRDIWTKAREKAQREKGLGVDPTIKALIWNPLMGDEEEADEGEGESGDVTAPRAPPPPVVPPQEQPPAPNQSTLPVITPNHSIEGRTTQNHGTNDNNTSTTQNRSYQNTNTNNPPASSRAAGNTNLRQTTLDAYPKQNRAATSNPYQRSCQDNTNQQTTMHDTNPIQQQQQQQQQQHRSNPYASTNQQRQQPQQQQQKTNPYASLRPSQPSKPSSSESLAKSLSNTGIRQSQDQDDTIDLTESPAEFGNKIDTSSTPQVVISTAGSSSNITPNSNANNSKSGLSGILSFSEFKALMQSLRHNRVVYEEHYGKEIIVLCKISPGNENKVFNVVKDKGDKKSKGKKEKVSVARG